MFFKKKREIPTFTFYDRSQDSNFIAEKSLEREAHALRAKYQLNNKMIGLTNIKDWVEHQEMVLKTNKERREAGLNVKNTQTLHMVFSGNPGTGKTECARLIGEIYYGLGILPTDSFLEVSRRDLVADGRKTSADKVTEAFHNALGGILFIDEAYSICYGAHDPDGVEAVDTLLKLMEDYREDIVVIMAGYTKEMNQFLQTNPGFESRVPPNNHLIFEDYSQEELIQIFKVMVRKNGYQLSEDITDDDINNVILRMPKTKGNARDVRNLIDSIKLNLDVYLAQNGYQNNLELITITKDILEGTL